MKSDIKIISFTGEKVRNLIPEIAQLRIEVFVEYPFLYIGDEEYEKRYLKKFLNMKDAIVVAAFDQGALIGISTAYRFIDEAQEFQGVLRSSGRDPNEYYCFGELILKKRYRGLGIGKRFIKEIEAHVRALGSYHYICFYTRVRPVNDPERPADYIPLDPFWEKQGFIKHSELIGHISYQEIGEEAETPKEMVFWIKKL